MNRRNFTTLMSAATGLTLLPRRVKADVGTQPNLLFVFPDQMRMHAMGIWSEPGYDHILSTVGDPVHTPNLNQFAKEGVLFTQACSTRPVCSPYRAMMMSGMYAARNGVERNCHVDQNMGMRNDIACFTDVLNAAGYETGYVGKTHWEKNEKLFNSSGTYVGPGGGYTPHNFDTYIPPGPGRHGNKFWFQNLRDVHNDAMSYSNKPFLIDGKADGVPHCAARFTPEQEADIVVDFINNTNGERDTSKPFSMFWSANPPHPAYNSIEDVDADVYNTHYADKTIAELALRSNVDVSKATPYIRYYFSLVTSIDEHFGRVLKALKESGEADNTIVVFTSDHGEMMGSQSKTGKNKFYDEAFLIPFILRCPGVAHRVEDLMLTPVDLMPTLLSMMGLKDQIPLSVQGCDYSKGIAHNDWSKQPKPQSAFYRKIHQAGVRTDRYSYMVTDTPSTQLFNLISDPYQMTPVSPASIPSEALDFLKSELGRWLKKSEDEWYLNNSFPALITYPPRDNLERSIDSERVTFDVSKDRTLRLESKASLTNET